MPGQGSYQVTIRPTGRCAPGAAKPGRQLNASARPESDGEIEGKSQTKHGNTEAPMNN